MTKKSAKQYTLTNRNEFSVLVKYNRGQSNYYPYNPIIDYIEVDIDFDHSTQKIRLDKYNDNKPDFNYRLLRSESDTLANWQSREHAIQYVSESAIIEAEKQVLKNIANVKRELKFARLNPVYLQLKNTADAIIKHFASDFTYHDALNLYRSNPGKFIWLIRESGTWLLTKKSEWNKGIIDYQQKNKENKCYWYNNGHLLEIENNQLEYYYQKLDD